MTNQRCKVITAILALIALLVGGTIYLLFRSLDLYMFNWICDADMKDSIALLRDHISRIPLWMEGMLPDGLWMLSYCLIIGCIWDFKMRKCWPMLVLLLIFAILYEIGQSVHLTSGTFDPLDIVAYISAFLLGTIYIFIINQLITTKNFLQ